MQKAGVVKIAIYDIAGRLVAHLLDGTSPAGSHKIQWHGTDQNNRTCAAGVYFVRLDDGVSQSSTRVVRLR